jgi:hypothetical protein
LPDLNGCISRTSAITCTACGVLDACRQRVP